ncbi:hypothetical protein BKA70DRAFT_266802 [Coprinopsis sp. MPI-PUGE-AT-0042]|nr:hypothetical protein BKA70DRAFT_266802 [Coprinopsis sp. MPI-PUGE-AT-0042]
MAEYALPAHRVPEYLSARDRTARWVNHYSPQAVYSPSYPPTPIEGYQRPPSPAASTHSLPPKMILRYNDGRGDVSISPSSADYPGRRRRGHHSNQSSPLSARPHDSAPPPPAPEKINILPSRPINHTSSTSTSSSRSKSVSHREVPQIRAPLAPISRQPAQAAHSPWHPSHARHATVAYPASQPHYDPRVYHPHQVGPDGMIYSHSAPPGVGNGSYYSPQASPVHSHGEERIGRERRGRTKITTSDSTGSDDSTYYMSPTGDKIHVLEHSPERSASSTSTKVGSPWSQTSAKKPFLSRLFGRGGQKVVAVDIHTDGRKLRRRHSVSDGQRQLLD